jgi:hypothetical protein
MTIAEEIYDDWSEDNHNMLLYGQSVEKASYEKGLKDGKEKSFAGNSLLFKKGYAEGQKDARKECLLKLQQIVKKRLPQNVHIADECDCCDVGYSNVYQIYEEINKELEKVEE